MHTCMDDKVINHLIKALLVVTWDLLVLSWDLLVLSWDLLGVITMTLTNLTDQLNHIDLLSILLSQTQRVPLYLSSQQQF